MKVGGLAMPFGGFPSFMAEPMATAEALADEWRPWVETAIAAFQPNVDNMKPMSQPHLAATISTGGAAKGVRVPPIEMLTNRAPTIA